MKKILITAPVHQDIKIFKEYLWSLNRLIIPEEYEVYKYFYLHNAGNLKKFLKPNEYEIFNDNVEVQQSDLTHIWTQQNFSAVAQMRTKALEYARNNNFDYIFSVDSDVILHKETLIDLLNEQKDAIAKIYWTAWSAEQPWNLAPNCYDGRNKKGQIFFWGKHKDPGCTLKDLCCLYLIMMNSLYRSYYKINISFHYRCYFF